MKYWIGAAVVVLAAFGVALSNVNEYFFFAGYVVLSFVVLATAWNILGGYAGYVNFGTPAFFGMGAYTAVVLFKSLGVPLIVQILGAAVMAGLLVGMVVGLSGAYASEWSLLSMYLLFIAVVTFRARGLFGRKSVLDA